MDREIEYIDIDDTPELVRIAKAVHDRNRPFVLRHASEEIAILVPLARKPRQAQRVKNLAVFRSAAGGWADVDIDKLLEDIYSDRDQADRPRADL